jgi:hypothetical protein
MTILLTCAERAKFFKVNTLYLKCQYHLEIDILITSLDFRAEVGGGALMAV